MSKKVLAFFNWMCWYIWAVDRRIRVWRSLVSRLNGVQEASSSNLDTRTKKAETVFTVSAFFFLWRDSNHEMQRSGGALLDAGSTASTP